MAEINIKDINVMAKCDPISFVMNSEIRYRAFCDDIAARVAKNDKIRIILLAGPSGSGKTTTANILADKIRERGLESFVISLDDFYRDSTDPQYPRLSDGERDFESIEALNLPELEKTLLRIADGAEFSVPKFDFKIGCRTEVRNYKKISHGCVIIEGLHAMNPQIYAHLPHEKILKIFISVSTNVNKNSERIISGRKMRFIRRMVRDSIYRASDAEKTLDMWVNVLNGEDKNLYPYRKNADIDFNTFHDFELSVMKPYVLKLISDELAEKNLYAKTVLDAVKEAYPVAEGLVPEDSLIREFIEGGKYEEFY